MITQLVQLSENVWIIQGGANIGVIACDGRCLIIDSGMDPEYSLCPGRNFSSLS